MDRDGLVRAIHDTPPLIVLAVTGGGVATVADLLGVPGASRTVLEVVVPYAEGALAGLVGAPPDQAVSAATAAAMATSCLHRAGALAPAGAATLGVGCTAALVSDRPKRGEHRAHVAVASAGGVAGWSLLLDKGARDRLGEDRLVSDVVLCALAEACGLAPAWPELRPADRLERSEHGAGPAELAAPPSGC